MAYAFSIHNDLRLSLAEIFIFSLIASQAFVLLQHIFTKKVFLRIVVLGNL
jgi:hypothetical protein